MFETLAAAGGPPATVLLDSTHVKAEAGTIYQPEELAAIGQCAREAGLVYHMDGARLTNVLVTLGCSPAAVTSKVRVDILSFGATKNGAMNTEAIIVLNPKLREPVALRRTAFYSAHSSVR